MSYIPFKEVTVANPGSATRYGSDDLLDVMKIFNAKVVSNKRPEIINPWRWSSWMEVKQVTEASVTTPTEANVAHLFLSATDNKLKLKKTGGTIINLEDVGTGTWSPTSTETVSNKTVNIDTNTIKHSTTNATGDIMRYDAASGKYTRLAKGTALQVLQVNTAGTDLEYGTPAGGGGGGEANTASNVGSAGIGVFYQKLGVDLQFKSIFSPDASVLISDDTGNQKIDISLGAGVAKINAANTFGDFQNTFRSSRLAIANPANSAAYFFVASALTASRNVTLPLLSANDVMVTEGFGQTLSNKTLGTGTIANIDTVTFKHSTTNLAGELLVNNGTKFDRFPKGAANSILSVNASGTDLTWSTVSGGGIKMPADGTIAPSTGRWGAFYGGSGSGMGMMGFAHSYNRLYGNATSTAESSTEIFTGTTINNIAELKTGCGFRRDSTCVFKVKWYLTSTASCKVKIGLSNATALPAGGGASEGPLTTRYDVSQSSSGHLEFDGGVTRQGVRFDAGASGLNQAVREVTVRFRKYGTPSGNATVGIRKNSDGTLISLGTFAPNSAGSGEAATTISAPTNTYLMLANDRVVVEFPSSSTDGMELDQDDAASPSGYTSQQWTGSSWSAADATIAMQIKTVTISGGGGTSGDTPLASSSGVMIHGTIGTHTNYQVARNNGAASATVDDSTKALATTATHTAEFQINSTNCVVIIDGTTFTYTTNIPSTSTPMTWFMHIETAAASEKGLGISYAQVVITS